jgi:riboflavin kinase/FMN adenylyltransferase
VRTDRASAPTVGRSAHPDGAAVTVGAFDGVHVGHRALIDATVGEARSRRMPSVVLTFATHPAAVLRPDRAPALLCTREEKLEAIASLGVDRVAMLPFTPAVAHLTAREFVERVLVQRLGTKHLVIGHDHALGRDRVGDAEELRRLGEEFGFGVTVVDPVRLDPAPAGGAGPVSSSAIRAALAVGDVRAAEVMLGRPYWLTGEVVRGEGRGREIGVPTANLDIPGGKLLPAAGIYAARAWVGGPAPAAVSPDGPRLADEASEEPSPVPAGPLDAVLHVGPRPVFDDARVTVETHLIEHRLDLYGRRLRLELVDRLRDVAGFDSVSDLVAAIRRDVRDAEAALRRA